MRTRVFGHCDDRDELVVEVGGMAKMKDERDRAGRIMSREPLSSFSFPLFAPLVAPNLNRRRIGLSDGRWRSEELIYVTFCPSDLTERSESCEPESSPSLLSHACIP